jgi:hypothetical protein
LTFCRRNDTYPLQIIWDKRPNADFCVESIVKLLLTTWALAG